MLGTLLALNTQSVYLHTSHHVGIHNTPRVQIMKLSWKERRSFLSIGYFLFQAQSDFDLLIVGLPSVIIW
jgi:hypothetical protein